MFLGPDGGGNELSLDISDVLQFPDGVNDFTVSGDPGDAVALLGDWQVVSQPYDFTIYAHPDSDTRVAIEDDLSLQVIV